MNDPDGVAAGDEGVRRGDGKASRREGHEVRAAVLVLVFEPVVNLKTAKALGVVVPPSLRLRADHLIE